MNNESVDDDLKEFLVGNTKCGAFVASFIPVTDKYYMHDLKTNTYRRVKTRDCVLSLLKNPTSFAGGHEKDSGFMHVEEYENLLRCNVVTPAQLLKFPNNKEALQAVLTYTGLA